MKLTLAAVILGAVTFTAQASPLDQLKQLVHKASFTSDGVKLPSFEVKARTGSTRVGGTNKSGKGSRYVGGRK